MDNKKYLMKFECNANRWEDHFFKDVQVMVHPLVAGMTGSRIPNKHRVKSVQEIVTVDATAKGGDDNKGDPTSNSVLTSSVMTVCSSLGRTADDQAVNKQNTWSPNMTAGLVV